MRSYIVATQAGQRAQRQEQETEKKERARDESWGLEKYKPEGDEESGIEGGWEDSEIGGEV